MCVSPLNIRYEDKRRGPQVQQVPCRVCWQCRKNKVDDIVGRGLAEQSVSDWSAFITLTYAPSPDRDRDGAHLFLTSRHVQNWVRALRDASHVIRYLAVGEYGDAKGRAHWHVLVFGKGQRPDWAHMENFHMPQWRHGHCWNEWSPSERKFRYCLVYILKERKYQKRLLLSKKPPLGDAFFQALADRHHALGAVSQAFEYRPPGGSDDRVYRMTGATRRNYLLRLMELSGFWQFQDIALRRDPWFQRSVEKVEKWLVEREGAAFSISELDERIKASLDKMRPPVRSYVDPYAGLEDEPDYE